MGQLHRRTVLRASGAALAVATLAGCLESEDEDGSDGAGDEPLSIENATLTDGEPAGYQDYTETTTDTYDESDVVWFYFEPVGFARESVDGGEAEVDIEMGFSVEGPDGQELFADTSTLSRTVPEGESVDAFFTGNFQPPTPAQGGEYTAVLTVTDRIADEEATETLTFSIEADSSPELAIENLTFVESRPPGYREYDPVPDNTYQVSDTIWIYFEPTGFETESRPGSEVGFDLVTSLVLTSPSGTTVYDDSELIRGTVSEQEVDEEFIFWNVAMPSDPEIGEYTAQISLEDQLTDRTTETTATFTVEAPDRSEYAEQFTSLIESELDAVVLEFREAASAELVYESQHQMGSDDALTEIGFIAGLFAGAIDDGWSVDGLVATVQDAEGERFRYEIDAETARRHNEGTLDNDEYRQAILDTLEPI
jgi:hypothetical protein